ncbi:MAG: hypothetical protein EA420_15935 [Candidatus Competibacteraceae bacterium]|nr:MAG: hypothetical protein EA420_15935 [Candidatus Competibacteraceae bacterium]
MMIYRYARHIVPGPDGYQVWHESGDEDLVSVIEEAEGLTYLAIDGDPPPQPPLVDLQPASLTALGNRVAHYYGQVGAEIDAPLWQQPWGAGDPTMPMKDAWRRHDGMLWQSSIDHNVWEPGVIGTWRQPLVKFPRWIQPPGAGMGYPIGFGVTHGGGRWVNTVADNTFAPGVHGWTWAEGQGEEPGPVQTWVDTGVSIIQLVASGVYRCSGIPTIALNQAVRLGDTSAGETVFTGYWPTTGTPSDYIKIAPHVAVANGVKVWKWQ